MILYQSGKWSMNMNRKNKQWGKSAKFFTRDFMGGKPAACHPLGCSYVETWQDNQGDVKGLCVHVNCKKGEQIFLFGETTNSSFSAKKVEPLMIYSLHVLFFSGTERWILPTSAKGRLYLGFVVTKLQDKACFHPTNVVYFRKWFN